MFDSNSTNPFTLPKMGNETALAASLEALSSAILFSKGGKRQENAGKERNSTAAKRTGRWTLDEKILFLYGLRKFGKGRWKKMSAYLPDRSLVQIKSHAQKVLKRLSEGEHVFRRLEENGGRLRTLLADFNETLDTSAIQGNFLETESLLPDPTGNIRRKRKKSTATKTKEESVLDGREHIIAASALCQLAAPAAPKRNEELYDTSSAPVTLPSSLAASFFGVGTSNHHLHGTLPAPQLWNAHYGDLPM